MPQTNYRELLKRYMAEVLYQEPEVPTHT